MDSHHRSETSRAECKGPPHRSRLEICTPTHKPARRDENRCAARRSPLEPQFDFASKEGPDHPETRNIQPVEYPTRQDRLYKRLRRERRPASADDETPARRSLGNSESAG